MIIFDFMKKTFFVLLLIIGSSTFAQKNTPKDCIVEFFQAFHGQDTVVLRRFFHAEATIQSVINKDQLVTIAKESIDNMLSGIASIPSEMNFEERLKRIKVRSDGEIAQVWTPYEFFVNEKLSHKGVNSFVLIKQDESWKIIHLIDTRRKE
jgi:hypothetical protein